MKNSKKYQIEILTLSVSKKLIFDESQTSLEQFEKETMEKHGTFVTLSSKEI